MKTGLRFALAGTVLTAAITSLAILPSNEAYVPRTQNEQGAAGAAAYLHGLRANPFTG